MTDKLTSREIARLITAALEDGGVLDKAKADKAIGIIEELSAREILFIENKRSLAKQFKDKQLIIAVDFDCTIARGYPEIRGSLPYAAEVLRALVAMGHRIILWTCRENLPGRIAKRHLDHAVQWYEQHNIPLLGINETPIEEDYRQDGGLRRKVHADMYIDDKNFPGGFPGWDIIGQLLLPPEQIDAILRKAE